MCEEFNQISQRIVNVNEQLNHYVDDNYNCQIVRSLPGTGFINSSKISKEPEVCPVPVRSLIRYFAVEFDRRQDNLQ